LPLVLVGGPGEEAAVRAVDTPASTLALIDPVVNLRELSALFSLARIVLTPDSGPRHVAQAVGTPTAVVMGPSDPRHTADHLDRTSILREEVPCGPCHQETCPLTGADHHQCMQRIAPERFARAALDLLSRETPC